MDGTGYVHFLYRATLPQRTGNRSVLLRVLSQTRAYLTIRLTALPSDPPLRKRAWTVARDDLDTMVAVGLAKRITHLKCSSCGGTMTLYNARRGSKPVVTLACGSCEECLEV